MADWRAKLKSDTIFSVDVEGYTPLMGVDKLSVGGPGRQRDRSSYNMGILHIQIGWLRYGKGLKMERLFSKGFLNPFLRKRD